MTHWANKLPKKSTTLSKTCSDSTVIQVAQSPSRNSYFLVYSGQLPLQKTLRRNESPEDAHAEPDESRVREENDR
jgi:hypothetical protein